MKKSFWLVESLETNKKYIFRTLEDANKFLGLHPSTLNYQAHKSKKKFANRFDYNKYNIKKIGLDELKEIKGDSEEQLYYYTC